MMKLLIFLTSVTSVYAAGGGHASGDITDLIAPAVNVAILVGFLVYKLKSPLKNHYESKSTNVTETLERASTKAKEAKLKLEMHQKKLYAVEDERTEILTNAQKQVEDFEKNYKKEIIDKTEKLKADAAAKVEFEKNTLIQNLNEEFVEKMIAKVKSDVASDGSKQKKVTQNMISQL